jgi:transcriptional regulator with XRE-family HTH domain
MNCQPIDDAFASHSLSGASRSTFFPFLCSRSMLISVLSGDCRGTVMPATWCANDAACRNVSAIGDKAMLVQKLRLQRGWSQEQLAELSGLSTRTIQRMESGSASSVETLKAIASVFEIDWSQLKDSAMTPDQAKHAATDEALALAYVRRIKRFYLHLGEFALIMGAIFALNLYFTPSYLWSLWLFAFWMVGLVVHGLKAFNRIPIFNGAWERRQVERQLGRPL